MIRWSSRSERRSTSTWTRRAPVRPLNGPGPGPDCDGQLLILRSTVFPGVTDRLDRRDWSGGCRSNRPLPGTDRPGLRPRRMRTLPQIVGGVTPRPASEPWWRSAYSRPRSSSPAHRSRTHQTLSNANRYISFAISNQFFVISERFGAEFDRIRRAMIADYPRMSRISLSRFAGGPCLLKDTMQLAAFNHSAFVLGQAAMMVNEGLPRILVEGVKARYNLASSTAAILGMAFKGNSDDPRFAGLQAPQGSGPRMSARPLHRPLYQGPEPRVPGDGAAGGRPRLHGSVPRGIPKSGHRESGDRCLRFPPAGRWG